jgi:hypothetical protein
MLASFRFGRAVIVPGSAQEKTPGLEPRRDAPALHPSDNDLRRDWILQTLIRSLLPASPRRTRAGQQQTGRAHQRQHNRRILRRIDASRLRKERQRGRQHQRKSKNHQRFFQIHLLLQSLLAFLLPCSLSSSRFVHCVRAVWAEQIGNQRRRHRTGRAHELRDAGAAASVICQPDVS